MAKPTISATMSANLAWLMGQYKDLGSQLKIVARAKVRHKKIGQRTVGRAIKGEGSTTIGSIDALAAAFGVEPWQLLHPDMPTMVSQRRLSLAQTERVKRLREEIADLSEPEQAELFANSQAVRDIMRDPTSNARLEEKGWSAAGKAVSRRVE